MPQPPADLTIRAASAADAVARRALIRSAWEAAYAHIFRPEEIDGVFAGRSAQSASWHGARARRLDGLAADLGADPAGLASLALLRGGEGEVTALYVRTDLQGRGIGVALWNAALEVFRSLGCPAVQVWTLAEATRAIRFYEGRGCAPFARGVYRVDRHREQTVGFRLTLAAPSTSPDRRTLSLR